MYIALYIPLSNEWDSGCSIYSPALHIISISNLLDLRYYINRSSVSLCSYAAIPYGSGHVFMYISDICTAFIVKCFALFFFYCGVGLLIIEF